MIKPQDFRRALVPAAHALILKIFGICKLEPLDELLAYGLGDMGQLQLIGKGYFHFGINISNGHRASSRMPGAHS